MTIALIQSTVCAHFGVTLHDLIGGDRHKSIVFARQLAVYLCRIRLAMSYPELGRAFGSRDHTTCMWACRKMARVCTEDSVAAEHLAAIVKALAPKPERQQGPSIDYSIHEGEAAE